METKAYYQNEIKQLEKLYYGLQGEIDILNRRREQIAGFISDAKENLKDVKNNNSGVGHLYKC